MKLYTEEQVKEMLSNFMGEGNVKSFLRTYYTPIELPSDEEIESANPYRLGGDNYNGSAAHKWQKGVEWVINKIKGGNK